PFLAATGSQPISEQVAAQPHHNYCSIKKINYLWRPVLPIVNARMAELVDALVSNTSSCKAVPVRSRLRVQKKQVSLPAFFISSLARPSSGFVYTLYFLSKNGFPIGSTVLPARSLIMIPAIIYQADNAQNINS
ncbi:MAG: hypothetical protein ACD_77C00143G0001, partial [uncultured bacterium]